MISIKKLGAAALLFALCAMPAWPQPLVISQVVDGEVWQTTIVLTNTSTSTANVSLSFFQETAGNATQPWNLTFHEVSSTQSIALAGGETLLLHTPGTAANLSVGWGQVAAGPGVLAYAIFTKRPPSPLPAQVGTSEAIASASRILVPFDNTLGNTASMALVNTSGAPQTINVKIRTTSGAISQSTLPNIPAQGHIAFTFPAEFASTAGQSGLAEFYTSGTIALLALNFNPAGSLTTAPAYPEAGAPIIGVVGSGTALFSTFGPMEMLFTPAGFAPGNVLLVVTPNPDNQTYSAQLNGGMTFTNGIFTANGLSFSASILQPNATVSPYGYFLTPDSQRFVVSSGSLTFNLNSSLLSSNLQTGNITGTLSVTGTPLGGGAPVTLSGPVSGPYFATLAP